MATNSTGSTSPDKRGGTQQTSAGNGSFPWIHSRPVNDGAAGVSTASHHPPAPACPGAITGSSAPLLQGAFGTNLPAPSPIPIRGAPLVPSPRSRKSAAAVAPSQPVKNPRSENNAKAHNHHPDLPFLVTHWVSHFAPPTSLSEESQNAEGIATVISGEMAAVRQGQDQHREKLEAMNDIRQAASTLARAFETLGAFGHSSSIASPTALSIRPTAYSDLARKYSSLLAPAAAASSSGAKNSNDESGNIRRVALLDALVSASNEAHVATVNNHLKDILPWSLLEAAREGTVPTGGGEEKKGSVVSGTGKARRTIMPGSGRRVGDSFSMDHEKTMERLVPMGDVLGSTMHHPAVIGIHAQHTGAVPSNTIHAAQASRKKISLLIEAAEQRKQMESTMQSLQSAKAKLAGTGQTISSLAARRSQDVLEQVPVDSDLDVHRVAAQLGRRMDELRLTHSSTRAKAAKAIVDADRSYRNLASHQRQSRDPYQIHSEPSSLHPSPNVQSGQRNLGFGPRSHASGKNNIATDAILTRQYRGRHASSAKSEMEMSVLKSRLSHATTISCHLVYPVYCLKFDRTGNYFLTGADDQVVKLFHLGAGHRQVVSDANDTEGRNSPPAFNYGANMRGAVLVCTLRGHAGVVTDIDVNVDNALLATASGDGDVRVWGLKDGCPVAILRGHKDGANMVSWSTLTPFRLVSCGEDGLARMWDVSDAALKQYGKYIDKQLYHCSPEQEDRSADKGTQMEIVQRSSTQASLPNSLHPPPPPPPPPLQQQQQQHAEADNSITMNNQAINIQAMNNQAGMGIGGNGAIAMNINAGNGNGSNIGAFVANNNMDAGVKLIAQMQHGPLFVEEGNGLQGRVTRTAQKAAKVMCLAFCPVGGHFATGSDDGVGHVWADDDDWHVDRRDHNLSDFDHEDGVGVYASHTILQRRRPNLKTSNAPSKDRLLATLREHKNAVTDLKYSNAGDRILTASMKDGVVCIWSWGKEGGINMMGNSANPMMSDTHPGPMYTRMSNMSQLLIELTHVTSQQKDASAHCDGVAWTCDDMMVVTSQSTPSKAGDGTDIIPESHMVYVWDSRSGRCLMGIISSHNSLSSTLAPHPTLSSVIATAGADGVVNVWDLDRGDCFYTHTNTLLHGPADPVTNRGKRCGYLEVQFSGDGDSLVATDENGRVTILDTNVPARLRKGSGGKNCSMTSWPPTTPFWMREQYLANDYYELIYDANGYCIERGSEEPPHLAPQGVRCTHEGISHGENVVDTFRKIEGPLPLTENCVRRYRDDIRARRAQVRLGGGNISVNAHRKAKKLVRNIELSIGCESTALVTKNGELFQHDRKDQSLTSSSVGVSGTTGNRNSPPRGRQLSSRYRWIDYNDLPESEDDEEQDDEEYDGIGRTIRNIDESSEGESVEEEDIEASLASSPRRRQQSGRGRRRSGQNRRRESLTSAGEPQEQRQPSRASSRHTAQRRYEELNSDDEQLNEMMSTHTRPSGNFVEDWNVSQHLFKMPRGDGSNVRRGWLGRIGYQGNCLGQKFFCPQVGDTVVYIPRAHHDTLQRFPAPGVSQPWTSWPTDFSWPAVRCKVAHSRYRFPYQMYYKSRNLHEKLQGVSAVLTLEITGVPVQQTDRIFPWPAPNFIPCSYDSLRFEVTIFECNEVDFVIPEHLYTWRIKELEKAIAANDGNADGLSVTVHCPPDDNGADDANHLAYTGQIIRINETSEDEFHFMDSGYNALSMKWDVDEDGDESNDQCVFFCVWNINMNNPSCESPIVPSMGENVKRQIKAALRTVVNLDTKVTDWFFEHVDTNYYTDFLDMIEVPMYLSLIHKRLRSNYYTNKLSVIADMELVKENCYKYNEESEFYDLACQIYDTFKNILASIEEPQTMNVEETSQIDRVVANSNLQMEQTQPNVRFQAGSNRSQDASKNQPNPDIDAESSIDGMEGDDLCKANGKTCAHAGRNEESDTENSEEEDYKPEEATRRVRSSRNPRSKQSDGNSEHQEVAPRKTRRAAQQAKAKACDEIGSSNESDTERSFEYDDDSEEETWTKAQSPRKPTAKKTNAQKTNAKKSNGKNAHQEVVPPRRARRNTHQSQPHKTVAQGRRGNLRVVKNKPSYAEIESEEEEYRDTEDDESNASDGEVTADENEINPSDDEIYSEEEVASNNKRKRKSSSDGAQTKKRGRPANKKKGSDYPYLERWPSVSKRKMTQVASRVLQKLKELDYRTLFHRPVCEDFPHMANEYFRMIKTPMDFRTIEDERMDSYQHIADLQDDLKLTFQNCCVFNRTEPEYLNYSLDIWKGLNDVFKEACAEENVRLSPEFLLNLD